MTREELTNMIEYKIGVASTKYYYANPKADAIDAFEAGVLFALNELNQRTASAAAEVTVEPNAIEKSIERAIESTDKPKRNYNKKTIPVVHDGNKPNVHPRAKMVRVSFMGRDSYYGSITAAAVALHVTQAKVKYALKHNKTINGLEVSLKDMKTVIKNFSKAE